MLLGVNIDHIAYLREARKTNDPDPLDALAILKKCGADQITAHLREDRRHINDDDLRAIVERSFVPVNLECSLADEIIDIALAARPSRVTLVPEKREEVTTEGGLDVKRYFDKIKATVARFTEAQIEVSLFIDPDLAQIEAATATGAKWVELHTGSYANIYAMLHSNLSNTRNSIKSLELPRAQLHTLLDKSIKELINAANEANQMGLNVAAGHGLNYYNVAQIAQIDSITELNIGQSIVARAVFWGLEEAIMTMRRTIETARAAK